MYAACTLRATLHELLCAAANHRPCPTRDPCRPLQVVPLTEVADDEGAASRDGCCELCER